jgi:catechol 2,3-dioxygenase-like lactoylglutathione lyase family enzyme
MDLSEWDWSRPTIDHVHLRVRDLAATKAFYTTVLEPLGLPLLIDIEHMVAFPNLAFSADGPPTEHAHLAFIAASREAVDAFHEAGVAAGYRDNGAPGLRDYMPGYYAAYLLDPDGTNVEAVHRDLAAAG